MTAPVRRFLQKGGRGGVFFLHGDDEFRKDEMVRALVDEHLDPATRDFNLDLLRAADVDVERLASIFATPPMMAEWRVVVVRDVEAFAPSPKARELLVELAAAPPVGLAAILVASIPSGSSARFWKDLQSRARSLSFASMSLDDVPGWLFERAAGIGTAIEEDAARALAAAVGSDLGVLAREMDKLAAVVEEGATITLGDVRAAGIHLPAQDRWQWFDLVGARRFEDALAALPVLVSQGESGVALVAQLGAQLLRIGVALELGRTALEARLPPNQKWLANKVAGQARGWSTDDLAEALEGLLRLDRLMKASGTSEQGLIQEWLLGLMVRARAAA